MEVKEVKKDEETGEKEWILYVGNLKFHCRTRKEAEHLEMILSLKENWEILEFLQQQFDDDILKALKEQHAIFKVMILAMAMSAEVRIWGAGMAEQLLWDAVELLVRWPVPDFKDEEKDIPPSSSGSRMGM